MSITGKICLSIALILWLMLLAPIPGVWGGWAPKLLLAHNEWATELRSAKLKTEKSIQQQVTARRELNKAIYDVKAITFGWDKFWTVPARGQGDASAPTIAKQQGGRLVVTNLGASHGISDVTEVVNGQQQLVQPVIHAFYGGTDGESYAGEFIATNITANRMELVPVHANPPQFVQLWDVNAAWRLRTLIPAGDRTRLDGLYRQRRRLGQLTADLNASVERQQSLLESARTGLEARRGELLGNPDHVVIKNRPEYTEGLLLVTEQTEEERNQLALEVDTLRREILEQIAQRDASIEELQKLMDSLPSGTNQAQVAEGPSASLTE